MAVDVSVEAGLRNEATWMAAKSTVSGGASSTCCRNSHVHVVLVRFVPAGAAEPGLAKLVLRLDKLWVVPSPLEAVGLADSLDRRPPRFWNVDEDPHSTSGTPDLVRM
jgi:hypothetical protein